MTAELVSQFVDTNILVYAHDLSAGEKHARAKFLIEHLWETRGGCLSVQVLQEFFVTVTLKVENPMGPQAAARIIRELSNWQIHNPETEDVLAAIDLQLRYQISFWDAMILQSAVWLGCQQVLSEDLNSGQIYDGVQVVNPFEISTEG